MSDRRPTGRRVAERPGVHRSTPVRPRYGRLAVLGVSLAVTAVALLGAVGVIPLGADNGLAEEHAARDGAAIGEVAKHRTPSPTPTPSETSPSGSPTASGSAEEPAEKVDDTALPDGSGSGKRVVFSEDRQRVWLVDGQEKVLRTYLVSGSVLDNLHPGTYAVYSKSRWAVGVDDSGVMQYFARFTKGPSGAAIGFHTIPTKLGKALQTAKQLGTPRSHGCIRQRTADAIALWDFAPVGTSVVVTA